MLSSASTQDIQDMLKLVQQQALQNKASKVKAKKTRTPRRAATALPSAPRWYPTGKVQTFEDRIDTKIHNAVVNHDWKSLTTGAHWRMALDMFQDSPEEFKEVYEACQWHLFTERNWAKLEECIPKLRKWINEVKDQYLLMAELGD